MTKLAELEAAALRLSDEERLRLTDKLLSTLPAPPAGSDVEEILAEAIRRDDELEHGGCAPLSEQQFWSGVARPRK
jgi:hypothetical protein